MASVNLQYENLGTNCTDRLDSTIKYLENTIAILQSTNIPSNFSGRNELLNVIASLRNERQVLMNVKSSIICSNNDYNRVVDDLLSRANLLPVGRIEKRSSII